MVPYMVPSMAKVRGTLDNLPSLLQGCEDALQRKNNFPFQEFIKLIEKAGFVFKNQAGSHRIYVHPDFRIKANPYSDILSVQDFSGKAKPYQIKQFLDFIKNAEPKPKEQNNA